MRTSLRFPWLLAAAGALAQPGLTQTVVHELIGTASHEFLGLDIAPAGDVDGDGYGDLVTGALAIGSGIHARVISGRTGATLLTLPVPHFSSCAGAGDVDGDGVPDIIVGNAHAQSLGSSTGEAIVFSGATGAVLHTFTGSATWDYFGIAVAGAGDLDGDGFDDVIVGAPQWSSANPGTGYVRVFSGRDGSLLMELTGTAVGGAFGESLAGGRDVNGDGVPDLVVGASREAGGAGASSGVVRVFSGATGALHLQLEGERAGDRFGRALDLAGDVDGDSLADVVVGSPYHGIDPELTGKVEVFSGASGAVLHIFLGTQYAEYLGDSVAGAGDVDGDGIEDVIVASPGAATARVFSGLDGSLLFSFSSPLNPFARSVSALGDVTGDGLAEVAIADPIHSDTMPEQGRLFVLSPNPPGATPYCFGDGSGAFCPCGNHSAAGSGQGCANLGGIGARLAAQGSASIAADDLRLFATGLLGPALAFVGTETVGGGAGAPFGDGLRCAGGSVVRLGVEHPSALGTAHYGPGLGALLDWGPGDVRRFQVWYRNVAASACGAGFNLSNAIELVLEP